MISDFAVFLTIVLMVLLDYVIGVPTQKLKVPSKFQVGRKMYNNMDLDMNVLLNHGLTPVGCVPPAHQRRSRLADQSNRT